MKPSETAEYPLFSTANNHIVDEDGCRRSNLLTLSRYIENNLLQQSANSNKEETWLLSVDSPLLFAASVAACWMAGKIPVLSADLQSATLNSLYKNINGVITDRTLEESPVPVVSLGTDLLQLLHAEPEKRKQPHLEPNDIPTFSAGDTALVLFTSGSTGAKKRIEKPFFALFEEIRNLESTFSAQVTGLSRRTTVSHFHIYGFLFNILWPLHFGHPLSAQTTFYWEQVLHSGDDGACIISSPAHLRLLPGISSSRPFNWHKSIIFSSGGPLDRAVALEILASTGIAPTEIFGSTETGGVAHRRQQQKAASPFSPFSKVQICKNSRDGLEVRSPWTGMADHWVETGDRIEILNSGDFLVRGRYDNVVKIAGKRVSTTEMEQFLCTMPEVDAVRVFQSSDETRESRAILAAVIALCPSVPIPRGSGKQQLVKTIKDRMKTRFDLVTLPRRWRFVLELPQNAEGKVPIQLLEDILNHDE